MHVPSKYVRVDKYLCGQVSDSLNEESGSPREGETADSALGSSFRYPHIEESLWIVVVHQQMDRFVLGEQRANAMQYASNLANL